MEKTATLNLRVNPISLTGGIPFPVSLPKAPVSICADAYFFA